MTQCFLVKRYSQVAACHMMRYTQPAVSALPEICADGPIPPSQPPRIPPDAWPALFPPRLRTPGECRAWHVRVHVLRVGPRHLYVQHQQYWRQKYLDEGSVRLPCSVQLQLCCFSRYPHPKKSSPWSQARQKQMPRKMKNINTKK